MTQALYRKWRPHRWEQVIGQEHVVQTLRNAIAADRVAHAYLFAGPRGTGKTTTARLLAKAVNCLDPDLAARPCDECEHCQAVNEGRFLDLIEIDAASNTSVDDVRDLRDKINFSPNQGRYKVYIIDEVHMLSTAAFNALLKTLEEPPSHAIFILATTEVHKIPATVLFALPAARVPAHPGGGYRRLAQADRASEEAAGGRRGATLHRAPVHRQPARCDLAARPAGLHRAGITLAMAQVVLGTATNQAVLDLVDAPAPARPPRAGSHPAALDAGSDPRQFARQVVEYLRRLLLVRMGNADQVDATPETRAAMARHARLQRARAAAA